MKMAQYGIDVTEEELIEMQNDELTPYGDSNVPETQEGIIIVTFGGKALQLQQD